MTDDNIQRAAALLRDDARIAVLTGVGVSKESGVPTFRDAMEGLWSQYDPQQLATPGAFMSDPRLVWSWYEWRREMVRQAQPNPGHVALAQIEARWPATQIITQNVDDLHEQAGSQRVIHLHGNIAQSKCFYDCQGSPTLIDVSLLDWDRDSGPPPCPHCGRWVRPNVVWFGETLPQAELQAALRASQACTVMLVVGTSGLVTPAASLPFYASEAGAAVIEVNPVESAISAIADVILRGPSGQMLPLLLEAVA